MFAARCVAIGVAEDNRIVVFVFGREPRGPLQRGPTSVWIWASCARRRTTFKVVAAGESHHGFDARRKAPSRARRGGDDAPSVLSGDICTLAVAATYYLSPAHEGVGSLTSARWRKSFLDP